MTLCFSLRPSSPSSPYSYLLFSLSMNLTFFSHCTSQSFLPPSPLFPSGRRKYPRGVRMDTSQPHKEKILVIMGPTGCGKTRLSIDLATRFPSEIINSDKIQVYTGLDVTTNKIPVQDRKGVPHHLIGVFDPCDGELTPSEFRFTAGLAVSDIASRQKLPLLVGGSNSLIHALLVDRFDPELDVFDSPYSPISTRLRYDCCFLWVDVSFPLLCDYLCKRVDEMLDLGMFEELSEFYRPEGKPAGEDGLRKTIGVPEFDRYFKKYPPGTTGMRKDGVRREAYEEAVREIKNNTCQLAKRQVGKIMRLKNAGWDLQRVDGTEAFREVMRASTEDNNNNGNKKKKRKRKKKKKKRWIEIWEREVLEPSMKIVNRFLEDE